MLKGILLRFVGSMIALWVAVELGQMMGLRMWLGPAKGHPGTVGTAMSAALAVLVLGLVNTFIRPLILMLALPLNCLTFGLFGVLVNVILFWIVGSGVVPGFHIVGFWAALFGSVVMGLASGVINQVVASRD